EAMAPRGSWNGHDPWFLREEPGEGKLCRRCALSPGNVRQQVDKCLIGLHRIRLESRQRTAEILRVERRLRAESARQEASAQRTERDKTDAKLSQHGDDVSFGLAPPDRVLALYRRDRLHRMSSSDGLSTRFGQTKVLDFARANELFHCSSNVLDRYGRIDTM